MLQKVHYLIFALTLLSEYSKEEFNIRQLRKSKMTENIDYRILPKNSQDKRNSSISIQKKNYEQSRYHS